MSPAAVTVLQALRAGPIEAAEANERWGGAFGYAATQLMRLGYAVNDGAAAYHITEAGRVACPFRNPKAAQPATAPEVFSMPRAPTAKDAALAAVVAAGPAGITRAALAEKLGATLKSASNHLDRLVNVDGATVARLDRGLYVAQRFIGADGLPVKAAIKESLTTDADPAPTHDIDGVSLAVDHHDAEDLSAADLARQMALIDGEEVSIEKFSFEFTRAAVTEFACWSNGILTINDGMMEVKLSPQVAVKMRRFLGLFQEAA